MRNPTLHGVLAAHVEQAGALLEADAARGAEVGFEVAAEPVGGRRPPLYCYKPLTGRFVEERDHLLAGLATAAPALQALERVPDLRAYLRRRGEDARAPAPTRVALRAIVTATWQGSADFAPGSARFDAAYAELEAAVYAERRVFCLIAPVLGLTLESPEVPLSPELRLVAPDVLPDLPADARRRVLAVVAGPEPESGGGPLAHGRAAWAGLVRGLRLWDAACPSLAPVGWMRLDDEPWRLAATGVAGRPHAPLVLPARQEDELRAFCSLVARRTPRGGELAWALRRFELGLERPDPVETLTDHLLALRALLEPEGPASGRLAGRLAALCAEPVDRPGLVERTVRALEVEHNLVAGLAGPDDELPALVLELGAHLRALLRDTLCGHLEPDLRGLADGLIAEEAPAARTA